MVPDPDDAFHCSFVREAIATVEEDVGLGIRTAEIEHPYLLLLPASEEMRSARRDGDAPDDVIVGERLEGLAAVSVPYFTNRAGWDCVQEELRRHERRRKEGRTL